jgi:hypothetical protein
MAPLLTVQVRLAEEAAGVAVSETVAACAEEQTAASKAAMNNFRVMDPPCVGETSEPNAANKCRFVHMCKTKCS